MTLKQATKRLAALGFKMEAVGSSVHGLIGAEAFNYFPHSILSEPMRDVFIGETKTGWYVTSHINFKGKRFRHTETHYATILNIFGGGATLDDAIKEFESNFLNKKYNQYESILLEGVPGKIKGAGTNDRPVRGA